MNGIVLAEPPFLPGVPIARPFVAQTVAATDTTVFTLPSGNKRCRIRKILGVNTAANAQWLIGYTTGGGVFTQVFPILTAPTSQTNAWGEGTAYPLPAFEFTAALGAAIIWRTNVSSATQQIMVEVVIW
jgi:hypothetical protein